MKELLLRIITFGIFTPYNAYVQGKIIKVFEDEFAMFFLCYNLLLLASKMFALYISFFIMIFIAMKHYISCEQGSEQNFLQISTQEAFCSEEEMQLEIDFSQFPSKKTTLSQQKLYNSLDLFKSNYTFLSQIYFSSSLTEARTSLNFLPSHLMIFLLRSIDSKDSFWIVLLFIRAGYIKIIIKGRSQQNFMSKSLKITYKELINEDISPIKKNIKIVNHKFPVNFFSNRKVHSSTSTNPSERAGGSHELGKGNYENRRIGRTNFRENAFNEEEDLIQGVISNQRKMKRVLRKHSFELKKSMNFKNQQVYLPPLTMRKGVTTAF